MNFKITDRHFLSLAIMVFYLLPIAVLTFYAVDLIPKSKSWSFLSWGILLTSTGTLSLTLLLYAWEKSLDKSRVFTGLESSKQLPFPSSEMEEPLSAQPKVTSLDTFHIASSPEDSLREEEKKLELVLLREELALKQDLSERHLKDLELSILKEHELRGELENSRFVFEEQLKQKNMLISSLQKLIDEQRGEMEKRQDQIQILDAKVHDLSYEIKTLLHLNETETTSTHPPFQNGNKNTTLPFEPSFSSEDFSEKGFSLEQEIKNPLEATALLQKCVQTAQKLTGAYHQSADPLRQREPHPSHYAIDQRRLFDSLRGYTSGLIFVYSLKEHKLLFVNSVCKTLLGWSGEKFLSDFSSILQEGWADWKKSLSLIPETAELQTRLLAKTKQGAELLLNCHLGLVSTGLFRNYVICVCYSSGQMKSERKLYESSRG
jgi:hypothetical protein